MSSVTRGAEEVSAGVALDQLEQGRSQLFALDTAHVSNEARKVARQGKLVAEAGWKVAIVSSGLAGSRPVFA